MNVPEVFARLLDNLTIGLPRLIAAALLLLIALVAARWLKNLSVQALRRVRGLPQSAVSLLSSLIYVGVVLLGVLSALSALDLSQLVLSTVASLGVVGLIVGFALQDITKQFASGIMLLLSRPFEIGDLIRVGVHEGMVTDLQLRTTKLRTAGGDEVLIPNADVYIATVYNLSRYPQRRLAVPLQLPFRGDLEALRDHLIAAVTAVPGVAPTPAPTVVCTSVADGKVSAELRFWVDRVTLDQDEVLTHAIVAASNVLVAV
ncbi:MAG: mechanosensitive ion channel family protein [Roseiflexaceae bacterium]|nr:mechanosensitive ion channel family protein [Roseiflexaceae bacterium]